MGQFLIQKGVKKESCLGRKFKSSVLALLSLECLLDIQIREVNTFEYIHLDFWGVVRTGTKTGESTTSETWTLSQTWPVVSDVRNPDLTVPLNNSIARKILLDTFWVHCYCKVGGLFAAMNGKISLW